MSSTSCFISNLTNSSIIKIIKEAPTFEDSEQFQSLEKDSLEDMLLRLRILGKFLGYLVFLPYQYRVPASQLKEIICIRNNVSSIDSWFYLLIHRFLILVFQIAYEYSGTDRNCRSE